MLVYNSKVKQPLTKALYNFGIFNIDIHEHIVAAVYITGFHIKYRFLGHLMLMGIIINLGKFKASDGKYRQS